MPPAPPTVHRLHPAPGHVTRRGLLQAAALASLAAAGAGCAGPSTPISTPASPATSSTVTEAQARAVLQDLPTADLHSHAGGIIGVGRVQGGGPYAPLAAPMREGGMAVACLAIVPDSTTHHVLPDKRIKAYREPAPGELRDYGQRSFQRLHGLVQAQGLAIIADAAGLARARSDHPSIVVTSEGADFLEGRIDDLDQAHAQWTLRQLQLTHYRVNDLGDIQTEPPVHDGLTPFGMEVIRRCNRLGIVVDVAHATLTMVKQAAGVATKPLLLSHTSLSALPGPRSRLISPEHARVIASTGGLIGIWPPAGIFPDMAALATGMARMAEVVGVAHVGLGSDMRGLTGPATFDSYRDLPRLAQAMLQRGFQPDEVRQILGGNYLRLFTACVPA